jgi:hypothetical protein
LKITVVRKVQRNVGKILINGNQISFLSVLSVVLSVGVGVRAQLLAGMPRSFFSQSPLTR